MVSALNFAVLSMHLCPSPVKVVTDEEYEDWLSEAKEKFAKEEIENNNLKLVSK